MSVHDVCALHLRSGRPEARRPGRGAASHVYSACEVYLRAALALTAAAALALGCDPEPGDEDAGACAATVVIGVHDGAAFTPLPEGGDAELVLGFQGFRMLQLALLFEVPRGAPADAEVSAFLAVPATTVELGQRTRERVEPAGDGFLVREWLVFFNDEPPSRLVDREAELEVIVRAGGCVGGTTTRFSIRDDEDCVDPDLVVDAGSLDAGTLDAAVCEGL